MWRLVLRAAPLPGLLALFLLWIGGLEAQELTLKRALPGSGSFSCPEFAEVPEPGEEARSEAGRLRSTADQALILGDQERARDLLARATQLNPASPELAYLHARVLETLGSTEEAVTEYCRALSFGAEAEGIGDAPDRIQAILEQESQQVPLPAQQVFQQGVSQADQGDLEAAAESFGRAWQMAPTWGEAAFNRGIVRARMGQVEAASEDLQRYLNAEPDADDALLVSERRGQLLSLANLPSPSAAFSLGLLFPGAGQFYSGRALGGLSVLTLTAGAVAAGVLIEEVTVKCVGSVGDGQECPPDRFIGEEKDTPYLVHGIAAAGAIAFIGAVESFFRARGRRSREIGELVAMDLGSARLVSPNLVVHGSRLHVNLIQLNF